MNKKIPTEKDVQSANKRFHDCNIEHYDKEHAKDIFSKGNQKRIKRNIERIYSRFSSAPTVLDVGCGTGNITRNLLCKTNHLLIGIDISDKMLNVIDKTRVSLSVGIAESLPYKKNSFDLICAYALLHHLYDPIQALVEFNRVLKPGGVLYLDGEPVGKLFSITNWARKVLASVGIKGKTGTISGSVEDWNLAEYQYVNESAEGLAPDALVQEFRKMGFGQVELYQVNNPCFYGIKCVQKKREKIRRGKFNTVIWPLFCIIAVKGK